MHHAYLYEGLLAELPRLAQSAKKMFGFMEPTEVASPDIHVYAREKFGIEEARALAQEASLRSLSGRALFVVGMSSINTEAQQALLKLFEEPQEGVVFVVLTPPGMLIPTLRSRFVEYPEKLEVEPTSNAAAQKFLKAAYKERSAHMSALIKEEEGAKERVREFLNALEAMLHKKIKEREAREGLKDIALVRAYISDRSASLKMLLEHLAATLPTL